MKKILSLGLLVLLCVTVFMGCGEASKEEMKYSAPHNVKVKLDDTEENIIKIDNLLEDDSSSYDTWYRTNGKVSFAGFTFTDASYSFKDGVISYLSYNTHDSNNVDVDKDKLINRLSEIYGEPDEPNSHHWTVSLSSGEQFVISVGAYTDKENSYSAITVTVKNKRWYTL